MWNIGRVLGLLISLQFVRGLILRIHYVAHVDHSFRIVTAIVQDLRNGVIIRFLHCNGRRLLFLFMYIHIFKGIYYNRYTTNGIT